MKRILETRFRRLSQGWSVWPLQTASQPDLLLPAGGITLIEFTCLRDNAPPSDPGRGRSRREKGAAPIVALLNMISKAAGRRGEP